MTRWDAARVIVINALVSVTLVATATHWAIRSAKPHFAVLDIAELYRVQEAEIATALVHHATSDSERAAALKRAATFGTQVTALLESLPKECRCVLLTRSAVIGADSPLPDLTPTVRRRLGLAGGE